jgi:predicted MFS family arabinose efflux permease
MPPVNDGGARRAWAVTLAAAAILMVTMGARQSLGLFIAPLKRSSGLDIATISLALAIGQLMWGVIQPVAGAVADRYGPAKILIAGLVVLAVGLALTPFVNTGFGLIVTLGILLAVGSGAGSFSVLIGAASQHLAADKQGRAAGVINAGGSLGQFVFAPVVQTLIQMVGWMGAIWSVALINLAALPLVRVVASPASAAQRAPGSSESTPWRAAWQAMDDRSYLLLHAGFFTCGFHIAFLVTHLPGEVNLCGLPPTVASWSLALIGLANIVGSLAAGACTQRFRSKYILAAMYGSRAALIGWYLIAPKTQWTFYGFAVGLGLTWLATVPPTAAIVGKLFGARYLSTLFGLTLLSHQIGGFLGAYLGGLALVRFGNYQWMWYADMALAAAAALINLPIREARVVLASSAA